MGWVCFELLINFLEMLTSCYFASKIFRKEIGKRTDIIWWAVFSVAGSILLALAEKVNISWVYSMPAILIFGVYSLACCQAKPISAILWSLINYMVIGIVSIITSSIFSISQNVPLAELVERTDGRIITCVIIRLLQLLFSEIIIIIIRKLRKSSDGEKNDTALAVSVLFSVAALMVLWYEAKLMNEDLLLFFNVFICILFLLLNFGFLVFNEMLWKEKADNQELKIQNQLISMQIRNQSEISEMYNSMRALKHDINNHLHSISGYIQMGEYEKAQSYIESIAGMVNGAERYHSSNSTVDALFASKTNLAKANRIQVEIETQIPNELFISAEHLIIVLGNLFDNAIDANLHIQLEEHRYIHIKLLYKDNNLLIHFENMVNEKHADLNKGWKTTKTNKFEHGFGLKNIDRIVKMYDGFCMRELENGKFICNIRIPDKAC